MSRTDEQNGADRAEYGESLLDRLADRLRQEGMSRVESRELRRYRQFYLVYSRIWQSLTPELKKLLPGVGLPVPEIRESATPELAVAGRILVTSLSFTHLNELIAIDDALKRAFYEVECIRGNWSVRELKRQIGSFYFERSGFSRESTMNDRAVVSRAWARAPAVLADHAIVQEALAQLPSCPTCLPRRPLRACGCNVIIDEKLATLETGRGQTRSEFDNLKSQFATSSTGWRLSTHGQQIVVLFDAIRELMAAPVKRKRRIGFGRERT